MTSVMPPEHSFNSNNSPSPGHLNLAGAISGYRPDFNNGLRGDSNSGLIPRRLSKSDSNNGPPQAISILCQMELHLFMSPTYGFLAGAIDGQGLQAWLQYWPQR